MKLPPLRRHRDACPSSAHIQRAEGRLMGWLRRHGLSTLSRQIFVSFGATIVFMVALVGVLVGIEQRTASDGWPARWQRFQVYAGHQAAYVWDDPAARDRFLGDIAADLKVHARMETAGGAVLDARGPECQGRPMRAPVIRDGAQVGTLVVCGRPKPGGRMVLVLLVIGGLLWLASALLARHIARPLDELVTVADALGDGDLSARSPLANTNPDRGRGFGASQEIIALARALDDMAERIQGQVHDQRALLAAVSHELRTPLGHMRILLAIMRDVGSTDHTLDELEREVLEMDDLVDQLLATSRLNFDLHQQVPLGAIDIALQAVETIGVDPTILDAYADAQDGRPLRVLGDMTVLRRALVNLLRNAQEHGDGPTGLRIAPSPDGAHIDLTVEDDGPGLPDDQRQRLFDPFVQDADRPETTGHGAGTLGLGLFLVRRAAEAHGGDVIAENRASGGARVGLRLPRYAPSDDPNDAATAGRQTGRLASDT